MNELRTEAFSLMDVVARQLGVNIEYSQGKRTNDIALASVQGDKRSVVQVPLFLLSKLPDLALELIEIEILDRNYCLRFALCTPGNKPYPPADDRRKHLPHIQA